ncbi:hypothetical protein CKA32_006867 [Geitlerinema sp. FC II]|nr:hypothetical protein CKA32_006867 [Geitlerinema sp. FC II]
MIFEVLGNYQKNVVRTTKNIEFLFSIVETSIFTLRNL